MQHLAHRAPLSLSLSPSLSLSLSRSLSLSLPLDQQCLQLVESHTTHEQCSVVRCRQKARDGVCLLLLPPTSSLPFHLIVSAVVPHRPAPHARVGTSRSCLQASVFSRQRAQAVRAQSSNSSPSPCLWLCVAMYRAASFRNRISAAFFLSCALPLVHSCCIHAVEPLHGRRRWLLF